LAAAGAAESNFVLFEFVIDVSTESYPPPRFNHNILVLLTSPAKTIGGGDSGHRKPPQSTIVGFAEEDENADDD